MMRMRFPLSDKIVDVEQVVHCWIWATRAGHLGDPSIASSVRTRLSSYRAGEKIFKGATGSVKLSGVLHAASGSDRPPPALPTPTAGSGASARSSSSAGRRPPCCSAPRARQGSGLWTARVRLAVGGQGSRKCHDETWWSTSNWGAFGNGATGAKQAKAYPRKLTVCESHCRAN